MPVPRLIPFTKRADPVPTAPPTPEPKPTPQPEPEAAPTGDVSIQTLQTEINQVHQRLKALSRDREQLALPSLRGDTMASHAIGEIDAERQVLVAREETLTSALRQLQLEVRTVSWRRHLPNLTRAFRVELREHWGHWPQRLERLMLGRQSHDVRDLADALGELAALEQTTARSVADRLLPEARVPFHRAGDQDDLIAARKQHGELVEARQRNVSEAVTELLKDTASLRRPKALDEALARARQRLEVEARR